MGYEIQISESRKFLRVRAEGKVTVELARQWSAELKEMSRTYGIRSFLFDVRAAKNTSSVAENYFFAYKDATELGL